MKVLPNTTQKFEPLAPRAQAIAHAQHVSDVIRDIDRVTYDAVHAAIREWLAETGSVTVLGRTAP